MVAQVEYSVVGRSRGRVAPCAVCTVHVKTRSADFFVEPQNQGRRFMSGLASKILGQFLIGLDLKTDGDGLSVIWSQNHYDGFFGLTLKPVATVFFDLSSKSMATVSSGLTSKPDVTVSNGLPSKPTATVSTGLASKPVTTVSSGLALKPATTVSWLSLKTRWWRVFQFGPQNWQLRFSDLGLKITVTVSWFVPQN
jgi:hypothetical protein